MKLIIASCCLFLFTITGKTVFAAETVDTGAARLTAYAEIIRAQAEYVRMVGEARLQWARAALVEAQTANEWQRVRQLSLLVDRMQTELQRLAREEYAAAKKIKYIAHHVKRVQWMVGGNTSQYSWQSLRMILREAFAAGTSLDAMTAPVPALRATNFRSTKAELREMEFPGGNVGQLIHFMETNRFAFQPWDEAHVAVLTALQKLAVAAETKVALIHKFMVDLRNGVLNIWTPPQVKPMAKPGGDIKPDPGSATVGLVPPAPGDPGTVVPVGQSAHASESHEFCLAAKAGYADCRTDGGGARFCQKAERGFRECRAMGFSSGHCLSAKSGFKACTDAGFLAQECLPADSGFRDCLNEGHLARECLAAKGGYAACRAEGFSPADCLTADKGYTDCRNDGYAPRHCRAARTTYAFCRADGQTPSFCLGVGKGYQACRERGHSLSECKAADEGYKDCVVSAP